MKASNFKAAVFYVSMFTAAIIIVVLGRSQFDYTPIWLYVLCIASFLIAAGLLIDVANDRKKAKPPVREEPVLEAGILRTHNEAIWRTHLIKHFPNHQMWVAGQGVLIAMQHGEPIGAADTSANHFWAIDPKG